VVGLGPYSNRVTHTARQVHLDRRVAEAPETELIEQTEAFEQQLDPVLGEV
jgi:hypothetical protein